MGIKYFLVWFVVQLLIIGGHSEDSLGAVGEECQADDTLCKNGSGPELVDNCNGEVCNFNGEAMFSNLESEFLGARLFLVPVLAGVFLLTWSYWRITFGSRMSRMVNKFPGPPILPIIGSIYIFMGHPKTAQPTVSAKVAEYGKRFRIWKFHNPYVILVDAKDVEVILSSTQHVNKGRDYSQFKWMNGDGLITSSGDMWREDRKLLNPSFKYQRYDGFLDSFNKHGVLLLTVLQKYFRTGKEVRNIHPAICRCTMDTVFEGVLGATFNIQESAEAEDNGNRDETGDLLYDATKLVMKAYRTRTLKPWLALPLIRNLSGIARIERESKKCFTDAMIKVIEDRKEYLAQNAGGKDEGSKPFIDILLDTRSNQNLVDHAFTIFAAGFETNATAMNFVLWLLALNPECQAKVHAELDRVFEGDFARDASGKDIAELKYMEMTILETMRLFPPAPMFSRNCDTDIVLDDGAILPKGSDVAVFLYELHNDPEVYPNPKEFNPDRFLPEGIKSRHNYAFVPFSKGPRMCIGQKYAMMQMKVVLSHILRAYSVKTTMTRKDVNIVYGSIIEIDTDIYMTLVPRRDGGSASQNNNNV